MYHSYWMYVYILIKCGKFPTFNFNFFLADDKEFQIESISASNFDDCFHLMGLLLNKNWDS